MIFYYIVKSSSATVEGDFFKYETQYFNKMRKDNVTMLKIK